MIDLDVFRCERMHATMRKIVCVKRQTIGLTHRDNPYTGFIPEECQKCKQGQELIVELDMKKNETETLNKSDFTITISKDNSRISDYPDAEAKIKEFAIRHVRSVEDQCLFYILEGLKRDTDKNEPGR